MKHPSLSGPVRSLPGLFIILTLLSVGDVDARQVRLNVESMREASEAVVLARTVRTESYWNDTRTAILTRVTLQVTDQLTGEAESETTVIVPGGQVGDYVHEVSDMPSFTMDEEAVVFIERHASGLLLVSGGASGKIDVTVDPVSGRKTVPGGLFVAEERSLQAAGKGGEPATPPARMSLDEFKTLLRQ